jgi:uncharacterized Zn finger protein
VFDIISNLRPYFFSLREVDNNVSLDIKIPVKWKFEQIVTPYRSVKTKVQDKNEKFILLSLISHATSDGYDLVFACAKEVITTNLELEEKERLLQLKIKELQALFQSESLDKLKDLKFVENEQEDTEGLRMVAAGDEEGSDGSGQPQEEDD